MKSIFASTLTLLTITAVAQASLITAVPGPDDQGGMIMPMVTITATSGPANNPTAGTTNIGFSPAEIPVLRSLAEWSPGDWFAESATWRGDLSPTTGSVAGMPSANAGNGDLFNNQYGFMFMSMGMPMMANVPTGNSLAIRLDSISSPDLRAFNYGNADNRWDQVFDSVNSQVLWNGTMWHNYFTMPANSAPGSYTAVFEVFMASTPFTGNTGFAQYDSAALNAMRNEDFTSAFVTYTFTVIPEPAHFVLACAIGLIGLVCIRTRRNTLQQG